MAIPKQKHTKENSRINPNNLEFQSLSEKVRFSFEAIERNEYFNLDATCPNWASDLFNTLKVVSTISIKEIYAGSYSKEGSPLRIHQHQNAIAPCALPKNTSLDEMWQIRISASKGGIHGVFGTDAVFYVIWFDPQHNLYPNPKFGGLKTIKPPMTCCKDREIEIEHLTDELKKAKDEIKILEDLLNNM